jgi:hypothetical protein
LRKQREVAHRLNLELGPKSVAALSRLQDALETASQAETIRLALQVLAKLVDETQAGARVMIERRDEERTELLLPLHPAIATESRRARR